METGDSGSPRNPGLDADPSWSPDGEKIAFESKRSGNFEIYVVAVSRGHARKITRDEGGADPAWSPDGRAIAFVRDGGVFVMRADGRGARRLTASSDEAGFPGWLTQAPSS